MKNRHYKYSLAEIENLAHNLKLTFLDTFYKGAHYPHKWQCRTCNTQYTKKWNAIVKANPCGRCNKDKNKLLHNATRVKECHDIAKKFNLTFLGKEWYGQKHVYTWQCNKCKFVENRTHNTMKTKFSICRMCKLDTDVFYSSSVDLRGKKFNSFTVLSLIDKTPRRWLCKCDCGTNKILPTSRLKSGKVSECGNCVTKRRTAAAKQRRQKEVGKLFNSWTVIAAGDLLGRLVCECECGEIKSVNKCSVTKGKTKNCGCIGPMHKKEEECRTIFEKMFKRKFPSRRPSFLKNKETNGNLELDGFCEELKLAFEYDGEQHYKSISFGSNDTSLKYRQTLDKLKNKLCKEAGITLIRIPYWKKKTLAQFIKSELLKYQQTNHNFSRV